MESQEATAFTDENLQSTKCDKSCQAEFFLSSTEACQTFTCNRYIYASSTSCDAEIQTEISHSNIVHIQSQKQVKDKCCGPEITVVDKSVGPVISDSLNNRLDNYFKGFETVESDDSKLLDLTGVSLQTFNFLLQSVKDPADQCKITKENRLLIFLMKMKLGLTYSAISVIFCVHRTSVSNIFLSLLQHLSSATANLVFWPDKVIVQNTMPACFHPEYSNTRVIIDCTEFRIDVPARVDNKVWTYSHYKRGFTAKVLIGITPAGFICLVSKVAGGRKTDSQITIESGLLNLLEDGDVVLADKGFPEIRQIIDESGKKVTIVMPPFLKKAQFSEEETKETYRIAKVRIHVERIMQRLRTLNILNKIPENLFIHLDNIIHMYSVLVNLQPPIISENI